MPFVPGFLPSLNAPLFPNGPWPAGTDIWIDISGLGPVWINGTGLGLCGGMSFLTRDIFEAGTPQLQSPDSTLLPVPLVKHIQSRLIDSFKPLPLIPATWLELDQYNFDGTFARSVAEAPGIMADIDAARLCPIGVMLVSGTSAPWDVFSNHVELVWGYERNSATGVLKLHVYDCNAPGRDDMTISLDISGKGGTKMISTTGTSSGSAPGTIQGFFRLQYQPADPSPAYVDDAVVLISEPPPSYMAPGDKASVVIQALNVGSTNWTATDQYKLGSQSPLDNTTWGLNRNKLPTPVVVSQSIATFTFGISAPRTPGDFDFQWGMVREMVHWFGAPSPVSRVHVSAKPPAPPPDPRPPPPGGDRQ